VCHKSRKLPQMIHCLASGIYEMDRRFWKSAAYGRLLRDEAHDRLLVKFSYANQLCIHRIGILGQLTGAGGAAKNIATATKQMVTNACTLHHGAPFRTSRTLAKTPPQFDKDLCDRVVNTCGYNAVDSASNEILACEMLAGRSPEDMARVFPESMVTIRDCAHSSKRVLTRPLNADPGLKEVTDIILWKRQSIVQRIENSDSLKAIFRAEIKKEEATEYSSLLIEDVCKGFWEISEQVNQTNCCRFAIPPRPNRRPEASTPGCLESCGWGVLGASWGGLEASWASLRRPGSSLGRLGEVLGLLGEVLGRIGKALGHIGELLGRSWGGPWASWGGLGACWGGLGASW
jgi:hypothetical protein